jgi:glucokinase
VLHRGALGLAGEIGHAIIEPGGPLCACGNRGCFEAVAAGPAIVSRTLQGWAVRRNGRNLEAFEEARDRKVTGAEDVFAAAAAGDVVARDVIESTGRAIAWGIHLLALAYDVERIVIGGGVSHAGAAFMAPIRRELDRYRAASPLAAEILPPDLVQLLPAGADAGAWGAVTVARESLDAGRAVAVADRREVGHS